MHSWFFLGHLFIFKYFSCRGCIQWTLHHSRTLWKFSSFITTTSTCFATFASKSTVWTVNDVLNRSIPLELSRSIPFYWVDPYPFYWVDPYLFIIGMDRLNKRVWIDSRRHWRSTLYVVFSIKTSLFYFGLIY